MKSNYYSYYHYSSIPNYFSNLSITLSLLYDIYLKSSIVFLLSSVTILLYDGSHSVFPTDILLD